MARSLSLLRKGRPHMKLRAPDTSGPVDDVTGSIAQRAEVCCHLARQCEKAGDYEAACAALSEFWPNFDQSPSIENLPDALAAELLLRAGALIGWRGTSGQ